MNFHLDSKPPIPWGPRSRRDLLWTGYNNLPYWITPDFEYARNGILYQSLSDLVAQAKLDGVRFEEKKQYATTLQDSRYTNE